jgi:hypothetical protein
VKSSIPPFSGGNPAQHTIRLGYLLWPKVNLGPVPIHKVLTSTLGICVDFKNLRIRGSRPTVLGPCQHLFAGRPMPHLQVPEF